MSTWIKDGDKVVSVDFTLLPMIAAVSTVGVCAWFQASSVWTLGITATESLLRGAYDMLANVQTLKAVAL